MDEVGRGAWAGPVTVGVAIVPPKATKRTHAPVAPGLQATQRSSARVHLRIRRSLVRRLGGGPRLSRGVRSVGDAGGPPSGRAAGLGRPLTASRCAPRRRAPRPGVGPGAGGAGEFGGPVHPIVGGDARCASVAAASVLAKVVRDRLMRAESEHFPPTHSSRTRGTPRRRTRWPCGATASRPSIAAAGPSWPPCPGATGGRSVAKTTPDLGSASAEGRRGRVVVHQ